MQTHVHKVIDVNVVDNAVLPAPEYMGRELPRTDLQAAFTARARQEIQRIIFGDDRRLILIVGPCSIHDLDAGMEYAERLHSLAQRVADRLLLVMRVYFEKPRSTVGWKGLIMDPHLDGTHDIPAGLKSARHFLSQIVDLGVPTATELLDPITPQYIADLVCWSAIGARTVESQTHRQMASGLSMPLGFKNSTSGSVDAAINAVKAAGQPQTFLGISQQGLASAVTTRGNPNCHLVLRGGASGPNFGPVAVASAEEALIRNNLIPAIMVDCSHDNSGKDHLRSPEIFRDVLSQALQGRESIIGLLMESNLVAGSQAFPQPKSDLVYGQSITDPCVDWSTTEALILEGYNALEPRMVEKANLVT